MKISLFYIYVLSSFCDSSNNNNMINRHCSRRGRALFLLNHFTLLLLLKVDTRSRTYSTMIYLVRGSAWNGARSSNHNFGLGSNEDWGIRPTCEGIGPSSIVLNSFPQLYSPPSSSLPVVCHSLLRPHFCAVPFMAPHPLADAPRGKYSLIQVRLTQPEELTWSLLLTTPRPTYFSVLQAGCKTGLLFGLKIETGSRLDDADALKYDGRRPSGP